MNKGKIDRSEIKDALLRSGYLLESRVESILRENNYFVEANSPIKDSMTGKSRELDLYAVNAHKAGKDDMDYIFSVLLVECVNNPQPIAFMTKNPLIHRSYLSYDIKFSGLPVKIVDDIQKDSWISLMDFLDMAKYHHFCRDRVATQFCSFSKKQRGSDKGQGMALHIDEHFDTFYKLVEAVEYSINKHLDGWYFKKK